MGDEGTADEDHFELIGQVIDDEKITIKSVVGTGGFSVVYEGWHHVFDERVAIKCLKVPTGYSKAQIRDYFANFRREGQLLLKLTKSTHNVVRIFNMGEITRSGDAPVPYLVLEWLDGEGLDGWLARRRSAGAHRLSLVEMVALLDAGAEALAKAHAMGVAHRDVKPPNFQVTTSAPGRETVKLIDFGIAKQFDASVPSSRLETQMLAGLAYTPAYGAPEQFARDFQRGRTDLPATGPHSDVFSLALVCVEILTGAAPLGEDDNRLVLHHEATRRDRRPTPRTLGADVSNEVEAVFVRALAVDIESRYESVADFWRALHAAAGIPLPAWLGQSVAPAASRPSLRPGATARRSSVSHAHEQFGAVPGLLLGGVAPKPPPAAPRSRGGEPAPPEAASRTVPIPAAPRGSSPAAWGVDARLVVVLVALVTGSIALYYARGAHKPAPQTASCVADGDCSAAKRCCFGDSGAGACHECCPGAAGHCPAGSGCSSAQGYVCVEK